MDSQPFCSMPHNSGMKSEIQILAVELDGTDGLMVTFSDGTTGGYVVEELLGLRPVRERVRIGAVQAAKDSFSRDTKTAANRKRFQSIEHRARVGL